MRAARHAFPASLTTSIANPDPLFSWGVNCFELVGRNIVIPFLWQAGTFREEIPMKIKCDPGPPSDGGWISIPSPQTDAWVQNYLPFAKGGWEGNGSSLSQREVGRGMTPPFRKGRLGGILWARRLRTGDIKIRRGLCLLEITNRDLPKHLEAPMSYQLSASRDLPKHLEGRLPRRPHPDVSNLRLPSATPNLNLDSRH
jgi:hypothetical protein